VARLVLEDGRIFKGRSLGAEVLGFGEIVFNTGMTGYQEILTDPSYAGQIITLTYPEIGNYGCNQEDIESARYWGASNYKPDRSVRASVARGLVIKNYSPIVSNYRAEESLNDFLVREGIPAIMGLDTRALTRHLRDRGAMRAAVVPDSMDAVSDADLLKQVRESVSMEGQDLASTVTCTKSYVAQRTDTKYPEASPSLREAPEARRSNPLGVASSLRAQRSNPLRVVAFDFGIKQNILNSLIKHGCDVTVVPASTSAAEVLAMNPDGIFLSNGPGDPAAVTYAIATIRELTAKFAKPIFGICLGHQLLGLAAGAKTYKLKFGHRGSNQPIKNLLDGKIEIASHNHGFAISPEALPAELEITHLNINDNTVAGLRYRSKPIFSVQYHPEASPGPHDSDYLFAQFTEMMLGVNVVAACAK